MPGPPRKPTQLRLLAGTLRKGDPTAAGSRVELPLLDRVPDPPDWLPNAHAVAEWSRLAQILVANRLLTEGGLSALGMLCALHGKIVQLYAAGQAPTGALVAAWRCLTNDFGLTPAAQGRVRPGGPEPVGNKFANRGRRPK